MLRSNIAVREFLFLIAVVAAVFILTFVFNIFNFIQSWLIQYEAWRSGKYFFSILALSIALIIFSIRRWSELNHEIFERRKTEKKLQKSRSQLQAVLDGVPDMIFQVDPNGRILWANKNAMVTGITTESLAATILTETPIFCETMPML